MPDKLTPNTRELYASHSPALVTLMKPGSEYQPPVRVMEWRGGSAREERAIAARKRKLEIMFINSHLSALRHWERRPRILDIMHVMRYILLHDSPLAGSFGWLLLGARKPPTGRFSHFRAQNFARSPVR